MIFVNLKLTQSVVLGNGTDHVTLQETGMMCNTELNIALGAEGRVRCDCNVMVLCKLDKIFLSEVWVMFDLEDGNGVFGVAVYVDEEGALGVAGWELA